MKTTGLVLLALAICVSSGAALAQRREPIPQPPSPPRPAPLVGHTVETPFEQPQSAVPPRRPVFTIGDLPVTLWAPVEPPYDARANHTVAANPQWWDDSAL